jgi:hypothetical protein
MNKLSRTIVCVVAGAFVVICTIVYPLFWCADKVRKMMEGAK